jgi:hypothetical protein
MKLRALNFLTVFWMCSCLQRGGTGSDNSPIRTVQGDESDCERDYRIAGCVSATEDAGSGCINVAPKSKRPLLVTDGVCQYAAAEVVCFSFAGATSDIAEAFFLPGEEEVWQSTGVIGLKVCEDTPLLERPEACRCAFGTGDWGDAGYPGFL